jgi:hypothetical protein
MDRNLIEIHRKISRLREEMLLLQQDIRGQINHDLDCSESSFRLMAMRAQMVGLIDQRNAMGGSESCPDSATRLRQAWRPELRRRTLAPKRKTRPEPGSLNLATGRPATRGGARV